MHRADRRNKHANGRGGGNAAYSVGANWPDAAIYGECYGDNKHGGDMERLKHFGNRAEHRDNQCVGVVHGARDGSDGRNSEDYGNFAGGYEQSRIVDRDDHCSGDHGDGQPQNSIRSSRADATVHGDGGEYVEYGGDLASEWHDGRKFHRGHNQHIRTLHRTGSGADRRHGDREGRFASGQYEVRHGDGDGFERSGNLDYDCAGIGKCSGRDRQTELHGDADE